jgi:hypothetical protein
VNVVGWFTDYEKNSLVKIYIGDNSVQEAVGKGNIQVSMSVRGNERVKAIRTNVLHVPGIAKKNSSVTNVTKATSSGHVVEFGEKGRVITNIQKKVVALGVKKIPFLNCSVMLR